MAIITNEVSRTFSEYLILPGLTTKLNTIDNVNLQTPLVKFKKGEIPRISIKIPFVSAIMQSVSDSGLAIALAKEGGLSFIFGSQTIEDQVKMVMKVKKYKAGFVESRANLTPAHTLKDVLALKDKTSFSTVGVTDNGTSCGKLIGLITSRDYRVSKDRLDKKVIDFMTPVSNLITAKDGITLSEANDIIWEHKLNTLPIIDENQNLKYFVFRKDYDN
nr:IMP dehydrogenase [Prolixibacteraceae bacterium]